MSEEAPHSGADRTVEAEFAMSSSRSPLVRLSERPDCRVELEALLPRDGGRVAKYVSVSGTDPAALECGDWSGVVDVTLHVREDAGGLLELVVDDDCPEAFLAERGAVPLEIRGSDGACTVVVEIPPGEEATAVIGEFLEEYAAELVAKRRRDESPHRLGRGDLRPQILDQLTDRQREVLFAAFDHGYYERPRRTTGEEIAAELDITGPTFQQHLRTAERKVVSALAGERTD